jgi:ribosomal protein L16 Arg81 hydroxylase
MRKQECVVSKANDVSTEVKNKAIANEKMGRFLIDSEGLNANAIMALHVASNFGADGSAKPDIGALRTALEKSTAKVKEGDLSDLETMLVGQTHALHNMFMLMLSKIGRTNNIEHLEAYARIALKAQNQSRTTVSTLNDLKNPQRATFIKQLNQANQMQVNNSENFLNTKNELLDVQNGERLDSGATSKTSSLDSNMATVEKIDGRKNNGRKRKIENECDEGRQN